MRLSLARAASAYRRVLSLGKRKAEAHNNLGNIYLDRGKLARAATAYATAAQRPRPTPRRIDAHAGAH